MKISVTSAKKLVLLMLCTALVLSACTTPSEQIDLTRSEQDTVMPVYKVTHIGVPEASAQALANSLGLDARILDENGTLNFIDSETFQHIPTQKVAEGFSKEEGSAGNYVVEALDLDALFTSAKKTPAPDADDAIEKALEALHSAKLLPGDAFLPDGAFEDKTLSGHSEFEAFDADGKLLGGAPVKLDTHVYFEFALGEQGRRVLYEGPGAKLKLVFDGLGNTTQLYYGMRGLEAVDKVKVISPVEAQIACTKVLSGQELDPERKGSEPGSQAEVKASAKLVYYAPPLSQKVDMIYPYYACEGSSQVEGDEINLRQVYVKATERAPDLNELAASEAASTQNLTSQAVGRVDVGTQWVGESQGLGGSAGNAGGFANTFSSAGYPVQFNWGDFNAWERDFKDPSNGGNDRNYVDDVDAVFYTGHAGGSSFTFPGTNDDGSLHYSEASWGEKDLEWLVIAACGPLQATSGNKSWAQRWGSSFDGLHLLLAYANVSNDNQREGRIYAEELLKGRKVRQAWVKAATDVQPSRVTYAYMGVIGPDGIANINDYFWGKGTGGGPDIHDVNGYWKVSGPS